MARMTLGSILAAYDDFVSQEQRIPTPQDWTPKCGLPTLATIRRHFGSLDGLYAARSDLLEHQMRFLPMAASLILQAQQMGYGATGGDLYRDSRCPYGNPNSLHKHRLAIDLNLFRDGVYLTKSEDHQPLGEWWEGIGGTWGGRFNDGNHYSLAWGGMQ